jgi:pilus assembly protein FimV
MARDMKDIPSEEKKLEQYGVWVKVEPEEYGAVEPSSGGELMDLESPAEGAGATISAPPAEESFTREEEELLDELETEIAQDDTSVPESENLADLAVEPLAEPSAEPFAEIAEPISAEEGEVLPELDLEELEEPAAEAGEAAAAPSIHDQDVLELPDEAFPASEEADAVEEALPAEIPLAEEEALGEVDVPLSEESPKEEHFDDLAALEEELATVEATSTEAGKSGASVSGEILARIEAELKSIRSDLSDLKKELTVLKRPAKTPAAEKEAEAGGFFEEDEDETIALTGDELDNILSTAEITEGQAEISDLESKLEADAAPEAAEEVLDELPDTLTLDDSSTPSEPVSELELESLGIEGQAAETGEMELEPLEAVEEDAAPVEAEEIEMELEALPEAEAKTAGSEDESEPLELESVEEASPEDAPLDLEAIPEFEPVEQVEAAEEIELEALSPEEENAAELQPADALELEELPGEALEGKEKEIEIAFEDGGAKGEEEVLEAEEVGEEAETPRASSRSTGVPDDLKNEIRTVLKYMDQLLEALPEEKIQEFASSEYFVMYKKLFEDLGLGE